VYFCIFFIQEKDKSFFTWEYSRDKSYGENMDATKAGALLNIIEDLLGEAPDYDNFIKTNCFHSSDARFQEVRNQNRIVQNLFNLECYLSETLNERTMRKKIYTGGIFSARSTAELGDKPGLVATRFVRFLASIGLSRVSLKDKAVECRERGIEFTIDMDSVLNALHNEEEKEKCRQQIERMTKIVEEYILSK